MTVDYSFLERSSEAIEERWLLAQITLAVERFRDTGRPLVVEDIVDAVCEGIDNEIVMLAASETFRRLIPEAVASLGLSIEREP